CSQSVRLPAWQGPWIYPFTITAMGKYFDSTNQPIAMCGSSDGFIRLMDVGSLDDVLYNGTGGSNITMTVQLPVLHFGMPGMKKSLKWMLLQANLPASSALNVKIAFDGAGFTSFPVTPGGTGEQDYRVDIAGEDRKSTRLNS